jgi:ribonuclease HII
LAAGTSKLIAKSLKELRQYFNARRPLPQDLLEALERDPRRGARQLAISMRKLRIQRRREKQRLQNLLRFERELWYQGYHFIAGVDEAGMAPLAGPVVAAAVILPPRYSLPGLNDSKKIPDERRRKELACRIKQDAVCWSTGWAEVHEIEKHNIYRSGLLAMRRAIESLAIEPDYILVDARTIPHCPCPQKGIVRGDAVSASIAAASIIAKTTRDDHMIEMDRLYSGYGFASHKGYPTPEHLRLLKERGALPIHRRSFAPVRKVLGGEPIQKALFPAPRL